jgi:hypothetical protein
VVARRSPERDFRLEEVVDVEARHNQHGGGVREARIVWGWWGIAAEASGRWLELDVEAALTAPTLDLAHWSVLGPRDA